MHHKHVKLNRTGDFMKKAIAMIFLFLVSTTAFAEEHAVQIICKAGTLLSAQGTVEKDVFTVTITVSVGSTQILNLYNLKYKKTENSSEYYRLVKDDVASQVKYNDIYFVPEILNLSKGQKSLVHLWLPTTNDNGENSPILTSITLSCE